MPFAIAMMLEDDGYPEMHVIEVEDEMMIHLCESHGYEYSIITPNDIVWIPGPRQFKLMILFEKISWKNFSVTGNQFTELDFTKNSTI